MHWLEKRVEIERAQNGPDSSFIPGDIFNEIYILLKYGLIIAGFLAGLTLAFSFLSYKGVEPLNVAAYLSVFVLTQFILLFFLIILSIVRKLKYQSLRSSALFLILSNMICRLFNRIKKNRWKELSAAQRNGLEAVTGIIRAKRLIYGSLFYWPIFILSQLFMVAFNIGLLCATLLKVIGTDIAFGWQSTIQVGSELVFKLAGWIAIPWSWFIPAHIAHPSLTQVEGSHMVLKDGIYHLETMDLVSWWPFLFLALVFYGLLPRLILLATGVCLENRKINGIKFLHEPCEGLYRRMITPIIDTRGSLPDLGSPGTDKLRQKETESLDKMRSSRGKGLQVLIPDELDDLLPQGDLLNRIHRITGYSSVHLMRIDENKIIDENFIKELSLRNEAGKVNDLMIVQEAWQPPIREKLRWIKKLTEVMGGSCNILVGLIGKKTGADLAVIEKHDWAAWNDKIKGLGNPYISLWRLEPDAG